MSFTVTRRALLATIGLSCVVMGCNDPIQPLARVVAPARNVSSDQVWTVQLRALPGFATLQWGNMRLSPFTPVNPCVPPNPTVPAGQTILAICGKIFNEGGATYSGGGLYTVPPVIDAVPVLIAPFNSVSQPVDPCRRYDLSGYITLPEATAADLIASTAKYLLLFDGAGPNGEESQIGGRLDGSAWGPAGVRTEQDVFFGSKVCDIAIRP